MSSNYPRANPYIVHFAMFKGQNVTFSFVHCVAILHEDIHDTVKSYTKDHINSIFGSTD
jgi:hypothetical protein